jgi:Serine incorporator (Serinc)
MEGKAYEVVPKVFSGHYHLINFYCQLISFRYYLLACIIISDFAYGWGSKWRTKVEGTNTHVNFTFILLLETRTIVYLVQL